MNMFDTRVSRTRRLSLLGRLMACAFVCLLICLVGAATGSAKSLEALEDASNATLPDWISAPGFEYSSQNKPDPFTPFIKMQSNEQQKDGNSPPPASLPPLQRIQPTQLKLIGILWEPQTPKEAVAMVELPNGKGFVLHYGTHVGPPSQKGKVVNISPGKVTIRQETTNLLGEKESQNVVLKLHKSPGEKND
jgi:type IV pilus assembly protein PilP